MVKRYGEQITEAIKTTFTQYVLGRHIQWPAMCAVGRYFTSDTEVTERKRFRFHSERNVQLMGAGSGSVSKMYRYDFKLKILGGNFVSYLIVH